MKVVSELETLREIRAAAAEPFGLVPTMGFLHEGHLSLVRRAAAECATVGVSIFVNPAQFGPQEDLGAYPRDLARDLALLRQEGVEIVWTPEAAAMYGPGFQTWVEVEQLAQVLEGEYRPGHFRGVTTVVAKLFHAFMPQRAYFGQKDAQQVAVIRRMVQDLDFPLRVVACPTVREPDGLAMSSRNSYLDPEQRAAAGVLYRALRRGVEAFDHGERQADHLRDVMHAVIESEPLAQPQYISVADPQTLQEMQGQVGTALLSMAVFIGETRLIDNVLVGVD